MVINDNLRSPTNHIMSTAVADVTYSPQCCLSVPVCLGLSQVGKKKETKENEKAIDENIFLLSVFPCRNKHDLFHLLDA